MQTWLDEEAVLAHSQWATAGTAAELAALWLALASAAHSVSWSVALLLPVLAAMVAWRRMFGSCRSGEPEAVRRRMMRWATAAPGLLLCSLVLGGLLSGLRDRGCRRGGLDELQWLVAARACAQQGVRLGGLALALWRREMETGSRSDEGCPESVS